MQELETLLNALIEKGWKPFLNCSIESAMAVYTHSGIVFLDKDEKVLNGDRYCSLRDLVSLESGLRQFACKQKYASDRPFPGLFIDRVGMEKYMYEQVTGPLYRIMRASLYPEKDLAKFLVDNIIIEGNSK